MARYFRDFRLTIFEFSHKKASSLCFANKKEKPRFFRLSSERSGICFKGVGPDFCEDQARSHKRLHHRRVRQFYQERTQLTTEKRENKTTTWHFLGEKQTPNLKPHDQKSKKSQKDFAPPSKRGGRSAGAHC